MKHFAKPIRAALAAGLLAAALLSGGCSIQTVKDAVAAVTIGVENPAGPNTLAGIKAAYGLTASGAKAYAQLPLCQNTTSSICRRITTQQIKAYDRQAFAAVREADLFVTANPNVTPQAAYAAANRAIAALKAAAPDPRKK